MVESLHYQATQEISQARGENHPVAEPVWDRATEKWCVCAILEELL